MVRARARAAALGRARGAGVRALALSTSGSSVEPTTVITGPKLASGGGAERSVGAAVPSTTASTHAMSASLPSGHALDEPGAPGAPGSTGGARLPEYT